MTDKTDALEALREWSAQLTQLSAPGLRRRLVAAAWVAGETRVSALAEAARISRPTVYADLRSQDIDPDDRPTKEDPMPTLTIDGLTGTDTEADGRTILNATRDYFAEHPDGAGISEFESGLVQLSYALATYNLIRPLLAAELAARHDRDRALHLVEVRWEALNTATAWHAAHHSYVVAVDTAGTAIDKWADAAREASKHWFSDRHSAAAYEQRILAAGHPPVHRLTTDTDTESQRLAEDLTTLHERRLALAAHTLSGTPTTH
ncbi:hypothetical protein [Streptomyces zaomyceticus]|uniref:hypothetical protein n=1 Tax=Streptomyces zaomyceticus TaxID=68286 RepID=UPI00369370F0